MAKKKNNKIRLILVVILVVLIGITIHPFLRMKVKEPFYFVLRPVQKRFKAADSFLISCGQMIINLNRWQASMQQLEQEKMNLLAENAELHQIEEENSTLREALDMELQENFELKLVRVVGRRLEQEQFVLDKGQEDGIKWGMPVIDSQKVLLGKVIETGNSHSRVRLISHPDSSFSAQLKDKKIEAEIKGQSGFEIMLDFIPADQEIKTGQVVVTSALGGDYPPGLLVGEVKKVRQRDVKPFQVAEVDPYFKPNNDFLFVITKY